MNFTYLHNNQPTTLHLEKTGDAYSVTLNGETYTVTAARLPEPGALRLTLNGTRTLTVYTAPDGPRRWVAFDSNPIVLTLPQAEKKPGKRGHASGHDSLTAQMPGLVRQLLVTVGETVTRGQPLLTLEAMKMETRVLAPHAGVVEKILVTPGQTVGRGEALVELVES